MREPSRASRGGAGGRRDAIRITATPEEDGRTLETVLQARLKQSRRAARRQIDARRVFVNGRRVWMARHRVSAGDRIEIHGEDARSAARPGTCPDGIPILHETPDLLVVDKPAGLVSAGPSSVETALRRQRGEPGLRAAHRLDRDTTGCLMVARSDAAFDAIVERFRGGRIRKVYLAIALGRVPPTVREVAVPVDGQTALTRLAVLRANDTASSLRLILETGRTHQIRKHLLAIGHPLAGDKSYGTGRTCPEAVRALSRHMLHATSITFPSRGSDSPDVTINAPVPADFRRALEQLNLAARARVRSCAGR